MPQMPNMHQGFVSLPGMMTWSCERSVCLVVLPVGNILEGKDWVPKCKQDLSAESGLYWQNQPSVHDEQWEEKYDVDMPDLVWGTAESMSRANMGNIVAVKPKWCHSTFAVGEVTGQAAHVTLVETIIASRRLKTDVAATEGPCSTSQDAEG